MLHSQREPKRSTISIYYNDNNKVSLAPPAERKKLFYILSSNLFNLPKLITHYKEELGVDPLWVMKNHPTGFLAGAEGLGSCPYGYNLLRGKTWWKLFSCFTNTNSDLAFEQMKRLLRTHPPGWNPRADKYETNMGNICSKQHFDKLQDPIYVLTKIFCDLEGTTNKYALALPCHYDINSIQDNHTLQNKAWAAWQIIFDSLSEDFTEIARSAKLAHSQTKYTPKCWVHDRLKYLQAYHNKMQSVNMPVKLEDLFKNFKDEFIYAHESSMGRDPYSQQLHSWARVFVLIEKNEPTGHCDIKLVKACADIMSANRYSTQLWTKLKDRITRNEPPKEWNIPILIITDSYGARKSGQLLVTYEEPNDSDNDSDLLATMRSSARHNKTKFPKDQLAGYWD